MIRTGITQFTFATVVIGLIAGLCGCDIVADILTQTDEGPDESEAPVSIDIGLVAPLTGEYAAAYGISMERGFNLARDEINGLPNTLLTINLLVEDDLSARDGMVSAFERLIHAGVPAIVGIAISDQAQHAFPIAQENQVVVFSSVSSAAGLSSIGDYIFRAALAADKINPAGVNITHDALGYESAAMIYDVTDLYSTSSNEQLTAALLDRGVNVLLTETFQKGETDFTAQLTAIMESNPDALFISGLSPEMVRVTLQARAIGIEAPYIVPQFGMNEIQLTGGAADGVIAFTSWDRALDNPISHDFVDSYQAAYGIDPDKWAAQSYATLHILYHAITEAAFSMDSTAIAIPDAMAIRDALAEVRDFSTNLGDFSFDAVGDALYNPVVLIVKNGSLTPFGESEAVSP
ncbi:MAG: ABC transporter substrate-binding protein [Candidatus Poribacteria bacterium]|nr:ABC transporter substrate-binding protein [Candidatus Poribacteria bacterium]